MKEKEKISITFETVKTLFGVFGILFLCSGIIYNQIYLRFFNIDPSKFFNIQDYLSSSVDKIFLNIIAITIMIIITRFYPFSENIERIEEYDFKENKDKKHYYKFILLGTILLGLSLSFVNLFIFKNYPKGYYLLIISINIAFMYIISIIIKKLFQEPRKVFYYASIFIMFFSLICADAINERETIIRSDFTKIKNYTITFTENLNHNEKKLVLLTSNSNYYFFYDKEEKRSYVIPSRFINSVIYEK